MEPRSCKRGNYSALTDPSFFTKLQWNHAHVSVEISEVVTKLREEDMLQWNHAHVRVEILTSHIAPDCTSVLQWNHAHVSVEISNPFPAPFGNCALQWNHAHVSVEIGSLSSPARAALFSFNGTTLM